MAIIEENGQSLFPVIVQDQRTRQVLMMAYANHEALDRTRQTGWAHFFSRSRQALWRKGETSGHVLAVERVLADCDNDSFLYLAEPKYPVCHLNQPSCFAEAPVSRSDPLTMLYAIVKDRMAEGPDEHSYTWSLMRGPLERILKKVGEEAMEVVMAAMRRNPEETCPEAQKDDLVWEVADLFYHLTVMMVRLNLSPEQVVQELHRRHRG